MRTLAYRWAVVAIALIMGGCSSTGGQVTTTQPKEQVTTKDSTQAAIDAARAAEQRKQDEAKASQAEQEAAVNEAAAAEPSSVSAPQPSSAACTSDALLAAVADLFPDNDRWNPTGVDVAECQAGYARVFVVPDLSVCTSEAPECLEHEQVFLHDNGGRWEYLDSGTGISCQDQPTPASVAKACEALGLL